MSEEIKTPEPNKIAERQGEGGFYLSKQFRSPDADVTFESADKVRFRVHKRHLAMFTGGLPPVELVSDSKEVVELQETAIILDMLFWFARPQRFPDIRNMEIKMLVQFAEAAEKYEVYAAIMACNFLLRANISAHPLPVFFCSVKCQNDDLLDEIAPLILGTPLLDLHEHLPPPYYRAWLRYLKSLEPLRERLLKNCVDLIRANKCTNKCFDYLYKLIGRLSGGQLPKQEVFTEATRLLCSACSDNMGMADPFPSDGNRLYYRFTPESLVKIYGRFPKFSAFL